MNNKKRYGFCVLFSLLTITLLMSGILTSQAQIGVPQPVTTAAWISVAPTLVGVGQQATVNAWITPTPTSWSTLAWNQGYKDLTVTFTRPDGTKDTFKPQDGSGTGKDNAPGQTDPIGSMFFFYKPDMAGNWSVILSCPAQNFTDAAGTVQLKACTSKPAYFTVQEEPVLAGLLNGYPWSPLPNEDAYWTYPVSSNNREWYQIANNWNGPIAGVTFNPYGKGPTTGHILWTTQVGLGGLVGGDWGSISYQPSMSQTELIIAGRLIIPISGANMFRCYELTTGKLLYEATGTVSAAIGVMANPLSQATMQTVQTGVDLSSSNNYPTPYLFGSSGSTWNLYDPLTGQLRRTISNVTASGYQLYDGSPIVFGYTAGGQVSTPPYYLTTNYVWRWNLTKVVNNDWQTGIEWKTNVSRHSGDIHEFGPGDGSGRSALAVSGDQKYLAYGGGPGCTMVKGFDAETGQSIWNLTLGYVALTSKIQLWNSDKFVVYDSLYSTINCHSMATGNLVWKTNVGTEPWNTKASTLNAINDQNNFYMLSPDGSIVALSLADGHKVWQSTPYPSTEQITNTIPRWYGLFGIGGLLYAYGGYEPTGYQIDPIPRFAILDCTNATTGETVWTLNGAAYPTAAANGYLTAISYFSGMHYCIGKGKTSTSVTVQNNVIARGATALITGNVLDQSPAQAGTAAVADESMSEWMDYLHMQNATLLNSPPTPKGVQVKLSATGPDGKVIDIGTTTTTGKGNFALSWTPPSEGLYWIDASFEGSESYWSSNAQTALTVTTASGEVVSPYTPEPSHPSQSPSTPASSSTPATPTLPVQSPTPAVQPGVETSMPLTTYIAIAAVVVVAVVVAVALLLRRRAK